MALWNYCAICGKRIEVGEPCLGIEKENTEIVGDSICFDCVKVENINGLEKTVSITDLLARAEAAEARAEKAERERDAAVFDLLRAEEAAQETNALLDDEVHPACDYSLYLAIHDSVSDIVNWERDDVWRVQKEE